MDLHRPWGVLDSIVRRSSTTPLKSTEPSGCFVRIKSMNKTFTPELSPEVLEREKEILRSQAAESGKPPEVVERIVEGRLGKFYEENCLYDQHFIKDQTGNTTIGELIASKIGKLGENISVRRFARFKVGDGLVKAVE